ncbi:unnamed protein product [Cochlearia groenlandica]
MGTSSLWALVYVTITIMLKMIEAEPTLHRVGGGQYTWNSDVNFSSWSDHQRFYSGDWLFFGFDRTRHNILQVNKSSYENCIDTDFIFNITRGGRDVFQLLQPKPYYFICGKGYCLKGMKLQVNVLPQPPPSSPTAHIDSAAIPANALTAVSISLITFIFKAFML